MTFQQLGANFAKVVKSIDKKLGFLPAFPRKILFYAVCIMGIPFLVIAVLFTRNPDDITTDITNVPDLDSVESEENDIFENEEDEYSNLINVASISEELECEIYGLMAYKPNKMYANYDPYLDND